MGIFLLIGVIYFASGRKVAAWWDGGYCKYTDTQARVQRDIHDPWKKEIEIREGESFNVGSFHDGTGVFASDTEIKIVDSYGWVSFANNGQSIFASKSGTYFVKVSTQGQSGWRCEETAKVIVSKAVRPIRVVKEWGWPTHTKPREYCKWTDWWTYVCWTK